MVRLGSARIDEHGNISGGTAGDQTGKEVSIQPWYKNKKGWIVLRAKDNFTRLSIAAAMEAACFNDRIGYDQSQRNTLYAQAKLVGFNPSLVMIACETDCSALVRVCLAYAGIAVPDFNTSNERSVLMATGKFELLTDPKYTQSPDYLLRGDILVTATKGHTAVVLDDGTRSSLDVRINPYMEPTENICLGSMGEGVRWLQTALNMKGGYGLIVDGEAGPLTIGALKNFQQKVFPDDPKEWDGICGPKTKIKLR